MARDEPIVRPPRYTHHTSAVFGEKLLVPEPFGFELDTSELT